MHTAIRSTCRHGSRCGIGQRVRHGRPVHDVAREIHARVRGQLANARPFARRRHHRVLAAALRRPAAHEGAPEALQHGLSPHVTPALCLQLPVQFHIIQMTHCRPNASKHVNTLYPLSKRILVAIPPQRQIHRLRHTYLLPRLQLCPQCLRFMHQTRIAKFHLRKSTTVCSIIYN